MKSKLMTLLSSCLLILAVAGCSEESTTTPPTNGTLTFELTIGDYSKSGAIPGKAIKTLDLIDIHHTIHSLYASVDIVTEGAADNLVWEEILVDGQQGYDSELAISATLPPGTYRTIKLVQSNGMRWVATDGTSNFELQGYNNGEDGANPLTNIFSNDGLYVYDRDGNFTLQTDNERLGTNFVIVAGETTKLTMRSNFDTIEWDDADDSEDWSEGDSLDNWTLIPNTDTMVDFIVLAR